jgi:hypothetical protein
MSQQEGIRVSAWARMNSFAACRYKAVQRSIERRSFEHQLERIVTIALAHQSTGLSASHSHYKQLRRQADSTCAKVPRRWNITPDLLEAQIPAISKLKSLAEPAPKPEPAVLVSLGVAAAVALFFLMGILAGLTSVG